MDLESELKRAFERHADESVPPNLAESIGYSLFAPGKRIRPRLTLACAKMIGMSSDAALPAALSLEMIHCFTLIHDDLPCMDNDDFRRGRPSNHKKYGEGLALLAGDALMAMALDVFLDSAPHVSAAGLQAGLRRLSWAMGPRGVIGGQAAEMLLTEKSKLDQLTLMHAQKTGALFSASLLLPKDLAEVRDDGAIEHFAQELGLAFQVADDLEDNDQDATSILSFLSKEEAGKTTLQKLRTASKKLEAAWATAAGSLLEISKEVERKISDELSKT